MRTTEITTEIHVDLRNEYDLQNQFTSDTKITVIEFDSYMRLINLLTPEQRAQLLELAHNDQYRAVGGYVSYKI